MSNYLCTLLVGTILSYMSFFSNAEGDDDWKVVVRNVRIVNIEKGESRKGDIYRNVINGKYVILPDPDKRDMMYYIEYSDRPSYSYMFYYGDQYFGKKWYFNVKQELKLPIENDLQFVRLVKAYTGAHSGYYRLFRSVVDNSMIIAGDDPVFRYLVSRSDDPRYQYMFRLSGIYWYFSL